MKIVEGSDDPQGKTPAILYYRGSVIDAGPTESLFEYPEYREIDKTFASPLGTLTPPPQLPLKKPWEKETWRQK